MIALKNGMVIESGFDTLSALAARIVDAQRCPSATTHTATPALLWKHEICPGDAAILYGSLQLAFDNLVGQPLIDAIPSTIDEEFLKKHYGPQAGHLVLLIRAASALNANQRQALCDAETELISRWLATGHDPHTLGAFAALDGHASDHDLDAICLADEMVSESGSPEGVFFGTSVAGALAARHLIGEHFTAEHYRYCTQAWTQLVGPAHPDDDTDPEPV